MMLPRPMLEICCAPYVRKVYAPWLVMKWLARSSSALGRFSWSMRKVCAKNVRASSPALSGIVGLASPLPPILKMACNCVQLGCGWLPVNISTTMQPTLQKSTPHNLHFYQPLPCAANNHTRHKTLVHLHWWCKTIWTRMVGGKPNIKVHTV